MVFVLYLQPYFPVILIYGTKIPCHSSLTFYPSAKKDIASERMVHTVPSPIHFMQGICQPRTSIFSTTKDASGREKRALPDGQCCEHEIGGPASKKGCIGMREALAGIQGVRADLLE
jgi:hypothetical protein